MPLLLQSSSGFLRSLIIYILLLSSLAVSAFQVARFHSIPSSLMRMNKILTETKRTKTQIKRLHHVSLCARSNGKEKSDEKPNAIDKDFKPNKPISLPSLENPPDAGPLYNSTCRSVSGIENAEESDEISNNDDNGGEDIQFIPNKPIELDSLKNQDMDRSFLGIQPRSGDEEGEVPLLMETGLGVFTSSVILGGSIYFILAVFLDGDNVDPAAIPLSF